MNRESKKSKWKFIDMIKNMWKTKDGKMDWEETLMLMKASDKILPGGREFQRELTDDDVAGIEKYLNN